MAEPRIAIALRYERSGGDLPRVTAKGRGEIAERMVALARESGVPVRQDRALAGLLARLDPDSPIPLAAFAAVAEVLAHLYRLERRIAGERHTESAP